MLLSQQTMNFSQIGLTTSQLYLILILFFTLLIQALYYFLVMGRVAYRKKRTIANRNSEPVSVVVCAKNEYHNLSQRLPILLEQKYPDFEVVVVNDASTDETEYFLQACVKVYPEGKLKVVNMPNNVNFFSGKKYPLSIGIKSAKNDIILLTDADCIPNSLYWIQEMANGFTEGKNIVLGYGGYEKDKINMMTPSEDLGFEFSSRDMKPSFGLHLLIQYDTLCTAANMMGFALLGVPYMGVGRNLAYRRSFFFDKGGFIRHYRIKSGDDDLFVNANATKQNTAVVLSEESFTYSAPKLTYSTWFRQKSRHLSTGKYYKNKHKLMLAVYPLSVVLFYIGLVLAMLFFPWYYPIGILLLKIILQIVSFYGVSKKLRIKKVFIFAPLLELFFVFFNTITGVFSLNHKRIRWK